MASAIKARPIFVAATRQHVGKTTVSLAILNGLRRRFGADRVGFIKPVGQQHVEVSDEKGGAVRVDKDVQLMRDFFGMNNLSYSDMSPVLVPSGYTKQFVDGRVQLEDQAKAIHDSYKRVSESCDIVLLEGTGHVGVGSIIEMSNAQVAAKLGADMVLIANGGIGAAYDELCLNKTMCDAHGVKVAGVVVNKVMPDKVDMIRDYMGRTLMERWGIPLLGVVPDYPFLAAASLSDIGKLLNTDLVAGHMYRNKHYNLTDDVELVTTGLRRFLRKVALGQGAETETNRPIFVTHSTRDDIVLGYLSQFLSAKSGRVTLASPKGEEWLGALILCSGTVEGLPTDDCKEMPMLMDLVSAYDAPVMLAQGGTTSITEQLKTHTAKLHINDRPRIMSAIDHYEPHIDFGLMLARSGF